MIIDQLIYHNFYIALRQQSH